MRIKKAKRYISSMWKPSHTWQQQQLEWHQSPPAYLSSVGHISPSDPSPIPAFPVKQPNKKSLFIG